MADPHFPNPGTPPRSDRPQFEPLRDSRVEPVERAEPPVAAMEDVSGGYPADYSQDRHSNKAGTYKDANSSRLMNYRLIGLLFALAIFIADQAMKWAVINVLHLWERQYIPLLPFFDLTWTENRGVSMGFLTASSDTERWLLVGFTSCIAAMVAIWMWREKRLADILALGLVLGGALGNILDRARYGFVVDFLDLHIGNWRPFLVFNLADAAISIGVAILLVRALFSRPDKRPDGELIDG